MSIRPFKAAMVSLALAGLCLPSIGWAADSNVLPAPQIADVALGNGGVLAGQMVNGQNAPQSGVRVSLQDAQSHEVAAAVTDRQGSFAISGVRGGVYQLVTPQGRQIYRVWSPGMAPPAAQQGVLLIAQDQTVRGAWDENGNWYASPACVGATLGALVAAGIAIPVAYNAGINKRPSSN